MFSKKTLFSFFLLVVLAYLFFFSQKNTPRELEFTQPKNIYLSDAGIDFETQTRATTVDALLQELHLDINEHDQVLPTKATTLFPGMHVFISRAVKITTLVDGRTIENYTLQKNLTAFLSENNIVLGRLDKTEPNINIPLQNNTKIIITRINVEEKVIPEDIDFKTITNSDSKMGWREEKITQKGEKGVIEIKYKITYKNNKEISRVVLEKNITREPVTQITTKGTYMKLGGTAKGQGTWYAYVGGLFAASTSIPKGSYAKVTNTATGKSVVVQINDYGPQGKGRIIDLDKVAFQKIASLGAGVIGVKVEEILN
jgi:hypothetical protein